MLAFIPIQILIPNMVPRAPGIKELQGEFKVNYKKLRNKSENKDLENKIMFFRRLTNKTRALSPLGHGYMLQMKRGENISKG